MMQLTHNRIAASRILAIGVLVAALMTAWLMLAAKPSHASTTFTVNSTGDDNDLDFPGGAFDGSSAGRCFTGDFLVVQGKECTLRAAIQEANQTPGADTINFDIPGTGVNTISPASQLPVITGPVSINGYSQPGAQPNTKAIGGDAVLKIELSGAGAPGSDGLEIHGANSTVKGLVINRWHLGIRIDGSGATGNRVTGNYLGTDASGTQDLGNSRGIYIANAPSNVVGGTTAGARNIISGGNGDHGVSIDGSEARGNQILGNYVGTDASGTKDLGNDVSGINIESAPNNVIGGATASARNVISGNGQYGVSIFARGTRVMGNYIGTDATGKEDLGNSGAGVFVDGANNAVGGTEGGARNVVSGNDFQGVLIFGAATTGNRVQGNFIGTDASGTQKLGNVEQGVHISGAPNNVVGGTTAGARNVISANDSEGVFVTGTGARGNRVLGNYVGTDKSGTAALGNSDGVYIDGAPANTIGGTQAGARNIISGNESEGVVISGSGAEGNEVVGNYVGTGASGQGGLGNADYGVTIVDAPDNVVGGTQTGARNVISGKGSDGGVVIAGNDATGNRVLSNSIFANGGLGIDLGGDGPTPNDLGDADTGPNNLQNKPIITSARKSATGKTVVKGRLNSTPNKSFFVQFFSNPSGTDEGKTFIGTTSVTTDGSGNASFAFSPADKVGVGRTLTATATGPGGNTSEFSAARRVVAP